MLALSLQTIASGGLRAYSAFLGRQSTRLVPGSRWRGRALYRATSRRWRERGKPVAFAAPCQGDRCALMADQRQSDWNQYRSVTRIDAYFVADHLSTLSRYSKPCVHTPAHLPLARSRLSASDPYFSRSIFGRLKRISTGTWELLTIDLQWAANSLGYPSRWQWHRLSNKSTISQELSVKHRNPSFCISIFNYQTWKFSTDGFHWWVTLQFSLAISQIQSYFLPGNSNHKF